MGGVEGVGGRGGGRRRGLGGGGGVVPAGGVGEFTGRWDVVVGCWTSKLVC